MNATARHARATRRQLGRDTRAMRRAEKAVSTGLASAKQHMITAGVPVVVADRFAAAFSRGMVAQGKRAVTIKLKGRNRRRVDVKLYDTATAAARLATYRPKDATAAAVFERVAA